MWTHLCTNSQKVYVFCMCSNNFNRRYIFIIPVYDWLNKSYGRRRRRDWLVSFLWRTHKTLRLLLAWMTLVCGMHFIMKFQYCLRQSLTKGLLFWHYVKGSSGFLDEKDAKGGGAVVSDYQPVTGKHANDSAQWHPRF